MEKLGRWQVKVEEENVGIVDFEDELLVESFGIFGRISELRFEFLVE